MTSGRRVAASANERASYNGRFQMAEETPEQRAQRTADRPHHWTIGLSIGAIAASLGAIGVSLYSAHFAGLQYELAKQVRQDAKEAADKQKKSLEEAAQAAKDNLKAVQKSADAAATSAQAGQTALALNRRSLILNNQPNVVAFNSRLSQQLAAGAAPEVNTQIANLGKGMASKLQNRGWILISAKRTFSYTAVDPPPSISDLPPGGGNLLNLALKLPFNLSPERITSINSGTLTLYVYGLSEYYDNTLEKPRKSTLHWCVYYDPTKTDKLPLVVCPEHNYTSVE
jgi:hypothetical protein